MAKRKFRLITNDEYLEQDLATVRFVQPEENVGIGPSAQTEMMYHQLAGYLENLRLASNADGAILLPHDTKNALIRFMDMNMWLTAICYTINKARNALDNAKKKKSSIDPILYQLIHDSEEDDDYDIDTDTRLRVADLEHLLGDALNCAWDSLLETKRRRLDENWNYRVMARSVMICNQSMILGTDDDDPMIHDPALLELEPILQESAWLFFMRSLYEARSVDFESLGTSVDSPFVQHCYEIGCTDLLVTDADFESYTMQDVVTAYSLFLRATYTYPYSGEMAQYERHLAVAMGRLMSGPSEHPRTEYNMPAFTTTRATTHLREANGDNDSIGIKRSFFRFTDVLIFPTKLRIQTIDMVRSHCLDRAQELSYPSPRTEKGYCYWRSVAFRLVRLNHIVMKLEDSFFRNDFCNFPIEHIYQSILMENEVLRFSLERPGQEPDAASILETLREKDYIEINGMAKELPHYFCANYVYNYLQWIRDRMGVDISEFLNVVVDENIIAPFASTLPVSVNGKCPPLERACWPPNLPDPHVIQTIPGSKLAQFSPRISKEEATRTRLEVEFRPRTPYDNVAFFCYMYILNAWGRRASNRYHIYPDYVITDLIYRSDQIQEILRQMEEKSMESTLPYLVYVMQQCYVFHRGYYHFCPHFAEGIEHYIALFVEGGHVHIEESEMDIEDDKSDTDVLSVRDPHLLRHQSLLYHTDRRRESETTYGLAASAR
jgi:hypothetical protein